MAIRDSFKRKVGIAGWSVGGATGTLVTALERWHLAEFLHEKLGHLGFPMHQLLAVITSPWFPILLFALSVFLIAAASRTPTRRIRHRSRLIKRLNDLPGAVIDDMSCVNSPEPCRFAGQLKEAIILSGWKVANYREAISIQTRLPTGVEIQVQNPTVPPQRALVLKEALQESEIAVAIKLGESAWPHDRVWLKVGHMPVD